ncbi:MAG: glutamine--tRNA ligase [Gemmatimonadetes bacterium]|nr:glutamine--tRNA ligase [Gemmatimonadota bacterium]
MPESDKKPLDFIREIVAEDVRSGKNDGKVVTRFPPEPNGYLHIGHAMAFALDFQLAEEYGGICNLRFDDTNPTKEETEYVDAIKEDIQWLGFDWGDRLYFASDYFGTLYEYAIKLIQSGKAYVCDLSPDETREYRGTLTEPGKNSPYRDRTVEENLALFEQMQAGEFEEGEKTLRAMIDMTSPNINLRDPVMYRILKTPHHRTGSRWKIYPMYDFAHGQSDSIEGVTHSLCSEEYINHRPLYDWYIEQLGIFPSKQYEFARINVTYCVTSKRESLKMIEAGVVSGWDDPRMCTVRGMRRRGYTPEAIRRFVDHVGVTKRQTTAEIELLEALLREDLNKRAPRILGVLKPLKVVITNYPEDGEETFEGVNNPEDESAGKRQIPFSREIWVERDDFMEDPPRKFNRLAPGREVRLRYACYITCDEVIKDDAGEVVELRCSWDPESRGGSTPDLRKVRGTIHWVSAKHAVEIEARLYDRLFSEPFPEADGRDPSSVINPDSLEVVTAYVEPEIADKEPGFGFQFERLGYFCVDWDSTSEKRIVNRTITLRDSWAKQIKKGK